MAESVRERVERLEKVLAAHGIEIDKPVVVAQADRADYVPFGSRKHAQFLGLVELEKGSTVISMASYTSPRTGKTYKLEDEMGAVRCYPGIDPAKAVMLVLQQKVNELETVPTIPENAPEMFQPIPVR